MAKVITLSRTFPAYHPKAGKQTYFVQQVLNSLKIEHWEPRYLDLLINLNSESIKEGKLSHDDLLRFQNSLDPLASQNDKLHTIRAKTVNKKTGAVTSRWKQGDKASLRVWSGKAYRTPQIIIAPDVELVKVGDFKKEYTDHSGMAPFINGRFINPDTLCDVAENDGLEYHDLLAWFKWSDSKPFDGQILCWKEVDYV